MAYAWHPTSDAREPVKYATTYNKVFITQLYARYHISYIKLHLRLIKSRIRDIIN